MVSSIEFVVNEKISKYFSVFPLKHFPPVVTILELPYQHRIREKKPLNLSEAQKPVHSIKFYPSFPYNGLVISELSFFLLIFSNDTMSTLDSW